MTSLDYHLDKMFAFADGTLLKSFSDVKVPDNTPLTLANIRKYLPLTVEDEYLIDTLRTRMEVKEISFVGLGNWAMNKRFLENAPIRKNKK